MRGERKNEDCRFLNHLEQQSHKLRAFHSNINLTAYQLRFRVLGIVVDFPLNAKVWR
jgi:hypothetical protein